MARLTNRLIVRGRHLYQVDLDTDNDGASDAALFTAADKCPVLTSWTFRTSGAMDGGILRIDISLAEKPTALDWADHGLFGTIVHTPPANTAGDFDVDLPTWLRFRAEQSPTGNNVACRINVLAFTPLRVLNAAGSELA